MTLDSDTPKAEGENATRDGETVQAIPDPITDVRLGSEIGFKQEAINNRVDALLKRAERRIPRAGKS